MKTTIEMASEIAAQYMKAERFQTWTHGYMMERLMELVAVSAKAERAACEALYEHEDVQAPVGNSAWGEAYQDGWIAGAQAYRDAIRARGNT